MNQEIYENLRMGFETAYIDSRVSSNLAYKPQFISNNHQEGKKVISSIEDELLSCDKFQISVAFITMSGITPLLQTLKELEEKNIPGKILTTNYLSFSEPRALKKLHKLKNIQLKMYDVDSADEGFHTKGYIFKKREIYRIIIGSSNITSAALTSNKEWNTKIVSAEQGEIAEQILAEYKQLWNSQYALDYEDFIENYAQQYEIVKHQRDVAKDEGITSLEKYKLQPNSMQVGFITNLKKILALGEKRALLISATGTGKTYASAFAMRELGFKRVLFLVHRNQLAKQAKRSFEKVFNKQVTMGIVGAGNHDYDADYVFATRDTLWREEHLHHYKPTDFDCIILDEAHHSAADTYQRIMNYFTPKLWLGMTATPDKRDDNIEGRNIYEIFHYQIAYEIRLQQAMEENMLCPFHYFGISDLSMIGDGKGRNKTITTEDFNRLTSDERVKHIIEQANYFGYSGDRVKGLIFCSRIAESKELSDKFNKMINPDTIRKYVISGNSTIPGASTVHFDAVAKEKIFRSIDKIRGMKAIIRDSYTSLKNRLGRVPYLMDFYENGEIDPLVIIRENKTYQDFLVSVEKEGYREKITDQEKLTLEYLSKTVLSGVRPYELEILKRLFNSDQISIAELADELKKAYLNSFDEASLENAIQVLEGRFVSKEEEYQKYKKIDIISDHDAKFIRRMVSYAKRLQHREFYKQMNDLICVGLRRYQDKFGKNQAANGPFVLYEKYSRRDVSLLMNCGRDLSSIMYGMKRIGDDVFIFITYHKMGAESDELQYAEGKPDYADAFTDSMIFRWDSQIGKGPESSYMQDVMEAKRKHLLVKKSDAEISFYYMGTFDIISAVGDKKMDNHGKMKDITKVTIKMHQAVREDLLKYLESNLLDEEDKAV